MLNRRLLCGLLGKGGEARVTSPIWLSRVFRHCEEFGGWPSLSHHAILKRGLRTMEFLKVFQKKNRFPCTLSLKGA